MNNSTKSKILIVGAGMFVTGRGTNNLGTVPPAVCVRIVKMIYQTFILHQLVKVF